MALIRCYECGKEISSLATACPSCGAPPQPGAVPPPLPAENRPTSRAKQLFWGTIAVLTGVLLVLIVRAVAYQPITYSAASPPTPATTQSATTRSAPTETPVEGSVSRVARDTPIAESATTRSPPTETASEDSASRITSDTPIAQSATTALAPTETVSESAPTPIAAETPSDSDAPVAIATTTRATYHVIGIPRGDYLNVRDGAGPDHHVVTKLEPGTGGILLGSKRIGNSATTWQEITVNGQTGWVNAAYIALETQAPTPPTESSIAPGGQ